MSSSPNVTVERVLAGDVDAFEAIVRAHQRSIWRIVSLTLRERAATEDLVQQVFVQAYLKLDTYDPTRDLGAWLRTIARNQVRNELRRASRETKWLHRYHDDLSLRLENDAAAEQAEQSLRRDLSKCRDELSEPATQALDMRYEQELGFEEIAAALGRTVAATRQLLSRVRIALRRCVGQRRSHA